MKIREMELLVRVARTGSMTVAAQQLHLTPAAVSASVQRIENAIGVRLFERTTRSLHPTDEGLVVIGGCQDVVDRWQRALDEARGHRKELEGTVHLSAPADTTYQILETIVGTLCMEHPELRVVLDTSDAVMHLHRDAIDMAIRYGPLADSTLSARKLAEHPGVLVASPSYLAARGTPRTPEDLARHRCLTLQLSSVPVTSWALHRDGEVRAVALRSPLCGDGYLARRWALAGMGIALKSLFDVIEPLEDGRLVRVLPEYTSGQIAIHAVFPSRRFQTARVRAVLLAVAEQFDARAARCDAWLAASQASG
ncbi:MAG: LysR family transcriptional regulator [Deltaproteobacteria bacterium]|nr:LysR family transcriptional regulator [Deltaproteobacteria bacterium]